MSERHLLVIANETVCGRKLVEQMRRVAGSSPFEHVVFDPEAVEALV